MNSAVIIHILSMSNAPSNNSCRKIYAFLNKTQAEYNVAAFSAIFGLDVNDTFQIIP